jgi:hypothetical protein
MSLNKLLETLEKGGTLVHDEVDELRQEIRSLQREVMHQAITINNFKADLSKRSGSADAVKINEEMKRVVGLILLLVKPDLTDKTIAGVFKRAFEVYQKAKEAE